MIVFTFGHTGSGKNYLASILNKHYGFHVLDADDLFTEEMMRIIKDGGVISAQMRDQFITSIVLETQRLSSKYSRLVVTQAFIKDASRSRIRENFPEAIWIYVKTKDETRFARLGTRKDHFADRNYAKTMDLVYEEPVFEHRVIDNDLDGEEAIIRQLNGLAFLRDIDYNKSFA